MISTEILQKKKDKQKIVMLTAYDFPTAQLADEAGIDIILVGDSLANVVLGLSSTQEVGMAEMLHHTKAVIRAVKKAYVVGDMPFEAYQVNPSSAVEQARRFIEVGCHAVKIEWFEHCPQVASLLVKQGIEVMGHVGLTPQTATQMKVRGKDALDAKLILQNAKALEDCGCFCVVLECVPKQLSVLITQELKIPTIGIGAGVGCDGQVLVSHDVLGLLSRYQPKFTKKYAQIAPVIREAFEQYAKEVREGSFPDDDHSFSMPADEMNQLRQ